jgi:hypothetical protein
VKAEVELHFGAGQEDGPSEDRGVQALLESPIAMAVIDTVNVVNRKFRKNITYTITKKEEIHYT